MAKTLVSDELWERIEPLLPPLKKRRLRVPGVRAAFVVARHEARRPTRRTASATTVTVPVAGEDALPVTAASSGPGERTRRHEEHEMETAHERTI